jgi:uncharacterized membrane protein YdjX (TVP38/TMEM64 family)
MQQKSKNRIIGAISILSYIIFVLGVWYYVSTFLIDKEAVRNLVSGYGIFAPFLFMLIQIGQNIIAPIAHYPILLAGGFIFGPVLGFLYNWLGTSIGTISIILLSRKFGRPLINKMVSQKFIKKYDHIIQKLSPYGLFLIYALPIFPDDEISYLIGVSVMPVKSIVSAVILGKIPGAGLSFMGDEVVKGISPTVILQVAVLIIGTLFYFRKNIKNLFVKKLI